MRNWDYRYTWIRDTTFTLWALFALGLDWEAGDFFNFVADVAESEARAADHVRRRRRAGADRTGAGASVRVRELAAGPYRQRGVRAEAARRLGRRGRLGRALHREPAPGRRPAVAIVQTQVRHALEHWREPDQGSGRCARSAALHLVEGRVLDGADAGARIAAGRGEEKLGERKRAAEEIRADVLEHAVDEPGVFVQHYETKALDASVLLIPLLEFLPPSDPRVRNTVMTIAEELTEDDLVLRYRVDATEDGLVGEEARSRSARSGWSPRSSRSASCTGPGRCARSCCPARARWSCTPRRSTPGAAGTWATSRRFTHLALINAVLAVIRAEHDAAGG